MLSQAIEWQKLKKTELVYKTDALTQVLHEPTQIKNFRDWIERRLQSPSEALATLRIEQSEQFIRACQLNQAEKVITLPRSERMQLSAETLIRVDSQRLKVYRIKGSDRAYAVADQISENLRSLRNPDKQRRIRDYELGYYEFLKALESRESQRFTIAERLFEKSATKLPGENSLPEISDECHATDLLLKTRAMKVFCGTQRTADTKFLTEKLEKAEALRRELKRQSPTKQNESRLSVNLLMSICRGLLALQQVDKARIAVQQLDKMNEWMRRYYTAVTVTIQTLHLMGWLALLDKDKVVAKNFLKAARTAIYMTVDDREWWLFHQLFEDRLRQLY